MPLLAKRAQQIVVSSRRSTVETVLRTHHKTHKFLTTRRHPIYYMPITKCGSTFLKNLFYLLDHDVLHDNPDYIHDYNHDFIRADTTSPELLGASPFAFTVIRKPTSRFLSLYFDKIYGEGPQNFPDMRKEIASDCGLDLSQNISIKGHIENCKRLIGWIALNLKRETDIEINPHWRPQTTRIATVEHLNIDFLTLDGLDWQLPLYMGEVIPDLKAKMKAATSRNKTRYPVAPSDILTPELEHLINQVYADDLVHYQHVTRRWKALGRVPRRTPETSGVNTLTTHTQNLNIIAMQKAGCTYLRNLTYLLDHGRTHPDPSMIASDSALAYRIKSPQELSRGVNVIVLRDPFARFFSLYFDKVWGEGEHAFPWIAKQIAKNRRFRKDRILSEAEHHDNCCRLLGFLQQRFEEREPEDLNPHWRPQSVKANSVIGKGFTPLTLENFDTQILAVSKGRIKGLEDAISMRAFRNETAKPISSSDLMSPWIKERLQALYAEDIALVERCKADWAVGIPEAL